jgi:hypothetical protein
VAEPSFVYQKTEHHTSSVLTPSGFLGRLDDLLGYDPAVRTSDLFFFELAWNALLDQVP